MAEQLKEEVFRKLSITDTQGNRFSVMPGNDIVSASIEMHDGKTAFMTFDPLLWDCFLDRLMQLAQELQTPQPFPRLAAPTQPDPVRRKSDASSGLPDSLDDFDPNKAKPSKAAKTGKSAKKKTGRKGVSSVPYTDEEEAELVRLIVAGKSTQEISAVLGRSEMAVGNKRYLPKIKQMVAAALAAEQPTLT